MVTKGKAKAVKGSDAAQLAEAVRESAQQIWLAGLGAFAKARSDRDKLFQVLVKQGKMLQARTKSLAEHRIEEVSGRVTEVREKVERQATESWDRLEQVFEDRVSRALGRLGVPTSRELEELVRRVDAIAAATGAAARKAAAKPAKAARKPAAKRAGKKPAAKPAAKRSAAKAPAKRAARKAEAPAEQAPPAQA